MGQSRLSVWVLATAVAIAYASLIVYAVLPQSATVHLQPVSLPNDADDRDWDFVDPGYTRLQDLYRMTLVPDAEAPSRIQLLKRRSLEADR